MVNRVICYLVKGKTKKGDRDTETQKRVNNILRLIYGITNLLTYVSGNINNVGNKKKVISIKLRTIQKKHKNTLPQCLY